MHVCTTYPTFQLIQYRQFISWDIYVWYFILHVSTLTVPQNGKHSLSKHCFVPSITRTLPYTNKDALKLKLTWLNSGLLNGFVCQCSRVNLKISGTDLILEHMFNVLHSHVRLWKWRLTISDEFLLFSLVLVLFDAKREHSCVVY